VKLTKNQIPKQTDIHQLQDDEVAAFLVMSKAVFPNHYYRPDQLNNTRHNKNKKIFVLQVADKLAGFLILNYMEETGYLTQIGVRENFRGHGFGNFLMDYALAKFSDKNFKRSVLNVLRDNTVAFNLYKKYGYNIKTRTWSFKVRYDQIPADVKVEPYQAEEIDQTRFTFISEHYTIDLERLHNLHEEKNLLLEVFHNNKSICFTRFDPTFPGCYPFELREEVPVTAFWGVIAMLKQYKLDHNFLRVTFLSNTALAKMLQAQEVELIDDLYYMEKILE